MVMPLANEAKPGIIPWLTYALIGLNVACFAVELTQPLSFSVAFAATPYELTHGVDIHQPFVSRGTPSEPIRFPSSGQPNEYCEHRTAGPSPIWLTLLTSLFLHANLLHLAGNMLFLSIFGQKIEEAFGRSIYLGLYLSSGVIGTAIQVAAIPESFTPILGASGAIAGVMGVYLVWFPRDRVRVLVFNMLVLIPAFVVIGTWISIQLLQSYLRPDVMARAGSIAHLSHIGGAGTGIVEGLLCWGVRASISWVQSRAQDQD